MVKRRKHRSDEIMLIPFLDILCSLIGVLVLIIVVLVVAQTQRISGRTREEIERAEKYQKMAEQKKVLSQKATDVAQKSATLKEVQTNSETKKQLAEKLERELVEKKADVQKKQASATQVQKEIADLQTEIRGLTTQEPDLRKKMEELLAELAKLQGPKNNDPNVQIVPTGTGSGAPGSVFFIDTAADKLTFYWNEKEHSVVSAVPEVIVKDEAFNNFLAEVKKIPNSKLVFVMRDDGLRSYNLGAGWAQSAPHSYRVEQVGKMPVPGHGELDMQVFSRNKLLGSIPMPAQFKKKP
jgi:hypothetical protein